VARILGEVHVDDIEKDLLYAGSLL